MKALKARKQVSAKLVKDLADSCIFANEQDKQNFRTFMKLRFPDELSASYISEWIERWTGRYANSRADRQTEACLKKAGYKGDR